MKKEKYGARIIFNIDFKNDILIEGKDFLTGEILVYGDKKDQFKQLKEEVLNKSESLNDSEKIKLNLVFKQLEDIMTNMSEEIKQQSTSIDKYKVELYYSPSPQYTAIMKKQKR